MIRAREKALPKRTVMPIGIGTRPHENGESGQIGAGADSLFSEEANLKV